MKFRRKNWSTWARNTAFRHISTPGADFSIHIGGFGHTGEPIIADELKTGYDVISFSGDKLLGAPQAGIILGKEECINAIKLNPITRALRPDKFTLAGLEATLLLCLDADSASQKIPTIAMMSEPRENLDKTGPPSHLIPEKALSRSGHICRRDRFGSRRRKLS